jgi:hypothetical protein
MLNSIRRKPSATSQTRNQGFGQEDFLWCPRRKDTPRQFGCTLLITATLVEVVIRGISGFGAQAGGF